MADIIQGSRSTGQTNLLNGIDSRRGFNFDGEIHELIKDTSVFTAMLMKYNKVHVNDPEKRYQERRPSWLKKNFFTHAAIACSTQHAGQTYSAVAVSNEASTSVAVPWLVAGANLKYVIQITKSSDDTKYCNFLVSNINNAISVDLIQMTEAPGFDIKSGDKVKMLGTAYPEGSNKTFSFSDKVTQRWASCQIFKNLAQASRTVMKTWVAGGNEWERILANTADEHGIDMELQFLFGSRVTGDGSGANNPFGAPNVSALGGSADNPNRTSISLQQAARYAEETGIGGARVYNNTAATYTYADFISDMESLFEFGPDTRYAFGGAGFLTKLTLMALGDNGLTHYSNKKNEVGVKYDEFITPHGTIKFVKHPLFRGQYTNKMIVVDLNNIDMIVFDDTFVETDVKTPGFDGIEHQFVTDAGIIVHLPEATVAEFNFA